MSTKKVKNGISDDTESVNQTSKVSEQVKVPNKYERFKQELKIHRQIGPALRKIQVTLRAIQNLKKKSIMKDSRSLLEETEIQFKKIEEILLGYIPD